jgi:hypothetical protein
MVTLSPFYIAKHETTYELWYEVYQWATSIDRGVNKYTFANKVREGHNGTDGDAPTEAGKNEPVTYISWRDAIVWCNAYSEMSGKGPVYYTDSGYGMVLRVSTDAFGTNTAADKAVMKARANGYRLPVEGGHLLRPGLLRIDGQEPIPKTNCGLTPGTTPMPRIR